MNRKMLALVIMAVAACGVAWADDMGMNMGGDKSAPATQPATQPTTQQAAVDVGNTVCPVSGETIDDPKLTFVHEGKIYHFCCDGCPQKFAKDPDKYIKKMAADPKKYGIADKKSPA